MPERYAIYFAPERDTALDDRAESWLGQPSLAKYTVSARRYGFHATLKAPMRLNGNRRELEEALGRFAATRRPVALGSLAPRVVDGFVALTSAPQPRAVTDFAADVVTAFEPFRAPLDAEERARRLAALLTPRQVELVELFGYPYVLEEFQFHMTLTDRLPLEMQSDTAAAAQHWFAEALERRPMLDRLVLFREVEPGADFERLDDYPLMGTQ